MEIENIKNLEDAFKWLESLDAKDIDDWLVMDEYKALGAAHHGFGTMIRNTLKLWYNGSIVPFFNELGIYHADDMSGIILTSFHRKKNNIELELDKQIKHYIDYWEKIDPKVNSGDY
jgi:hypothetical protein